MRLQDYLNEWGEDLPTYGSVVTKVVEKKDGLSIQVMDWQNFICDPVDFDSAPKIEKLTPHTGTAPHESDHRLQRAQWHTTRREFPHQLGTDSV
jgi:hypothetical protein